MSRSFFFACKAIAAAGTIIAAQFLSFGTAHAGPVEYVKVCSLYGAGFYYIPGTDICMKVGAFVEGGYGWSHNSFNVTPSFDVSGSNGAIGFGGTVQFGTPVRGLSVGAQGGVLWGGAGGSTLYPTNGNRYDVNNAFIQYAGFTVGVAPFSSSPSPYSGTTFNFTAGAANVDRRVGCSCGASNTQSSVGFMFSAGISVPVTSSAEIFTRYIYINVPNATFNIPGMVPVGGDINMITVGLQWDLPLGNR